MSAITPEQREQFLAAYDDFLQEAGTEEKEEVGALLRQTSLSPLLRQTSLSPWFGPPDPAIPTGLTDFGQQATEELAPMVVPAEFERAADSPEVMYFWSVLRGDSSSEMEEFLRRIDVATKKRPHELPVTPEGAILGTGPYQIFDPLWFLAGIDWFRHLFKRRARFRRDPPVVPIPNSVRLALVGDWGTGLFSDAEPSERVANQIRALDPEPDYVIHLGDVYYAGRKGEVKNNFLGLWPSQRPNSFAINANHEMYTGGLAYFDDLLRDSRFGAQNRNSYFALENDYWVIVGLDSAYHANKFNLYRDPRLDSGQIRFLQDMARRSEGKQMMVLSHHQGLDLDGSICEPLWSQVSQEGLGGRPAIWYWGHLHSGVVYKPVGEIHGRCCGYGAMPRARASVLENNDRVLRYESRLANDPQLPQRVVNGFALLQLEGPGIEEKLIDEFGRELPSD